MVRGRYNWRRTPEQLNKMSTQRLLAYKKMLLSAIEGPGPRYDGDGGLEITKHDQEWKDAHQDVRNVLATREHFPR